MSIKLLSAASLLGAWVRDGLNGYVYAPTVTDGLIVGAKATDGTGGRMFYRKDLLAFRAGSTSSTQWDTASVGSSSVAMGDSCTSSGYASTTSGNANVASATWSTAFGGNNSAAATAAFAAGQSCSANATSSIAMGQSALAAGTNSVSIGLSTSAAGERSQAYGAFTSASRYGQVATSSARLSTTGDAQANKFTVSRITTTATPAILYFDGGSSTTLTGTTTNVLTIPVSKAHKFTINVIARRTDSTSDAGSWTVTGSVVRGATGNAAFITTPVSVSDLTAGATSGLWAFAVTIDTVDATNNFLKLTATGQTGATIRWVASIDTVEVG